MLTININRLKLNANGNYYKDNVPFEFNFHLDLYFLFRINSEICNDLTIVRSLLEVLLSPWLYF